MKKFVDRKHETKILGREYARKEASLIIVHGRRQRQDCRHIVRFPDLYDSVSDVVLSESVVWQAHSTDPVKTDSFSLFLRENRL